MCESLEQESFRREPTNSRLGFLRLGHNRTHGTDYLQLRDLVPRCVKDAVGSGAPPSARTPLSQLAFLSCGAEGG